MAAFKKFEEINAWQKARIITRKVYQITAKGEFSKDYDLKSQIRRSATSVMSNIAEGSGRRTNKDFANFLTLSHGSAAETQSHLYIALDLEYINEESFTELYNLLEEVSKMIMSLSKHLLKTAR